MVRFLRETRAKNPLFLMQTAQIFSYLSADTIAPSISPAHPCRSEAQYGNEVRYLRKMIHASLAALEQAGGNPDSRRHIDAYDGLKVA